MPERITGEWRKRTSEAHSVRGYFRVENEFGFRVESELSERFRMFRRGDDEHPRTGDLSWWMHVIFG